MITIRATCQNGRLDLQEPLPDRLEGRELVITPQEVTPTPKHRQRGSGKDMIEISPDFDAPLEDFQAYCL